MIFLKNLYINLFRNLDKTDLKIMKIGIKTCFGICIFSALILSVYLFNVHNLFIYNLGFTVFKLSLYLFVEFIVCGIIADVVKKQLD